MDECKPLPLSARANPLMRREYQGRTLVHLSAQRKRFLWDKQYIYGLFRAA